MSASKRESLEALFTALKLGLYNEAILLCECTNFGDDKIFSLLYQLSTSAKEQRSVSLSEKTLEVFELAILHIAETYPQLLVNEDVNIAKDFIKSSSLNIRKMNHTDFSQNLLQKLTASFNPSQSCQFIHSLIDKFNLLADEIMKMNFEELNSLGDRCGPFAGSFLLDLELGKAFLNISQYKMAKMLLERAIRTNPYSIKGIDLYSTVFWHLNEKELLFALSLKCQEKWPETPETLVVKGNYFSSIVSNEQAISCFRKAREVNPSYGYALFLEGYDWLSLNNLDEAEAAFSQLRKIDPESYMSYFGLGIVHFKKGNHDVALKYLQFAAMKNPTHINIRCYTSIVFDSIGDKESALKILSQIDQYSAFNSPVISYQLSKLYHALGMPLKEESVLKQAIQRFPNDPALHFNLASIKKDNEDIPGAIKLLRRALELDLSNPLAKEYINSIGI